MNEHFHSSSEAECRDDLRVNGEHKITIIRIVLENQVNAECLVFCKHQTQQLQWAKVWTGQAYGESRA